MSDHDKAIEAAARAMCEWKDEDPDSEFAAPFVSTRPLWHVEAGTLYRAVPAYLAAMTAAGWKLVPMDMKKFDAHASLNDQCKWVEWVGMAPPPDTAP